MTELAAIGDERRETRLNARYEFGSSQQIKHIKPMFNPGFSPRPRRLLITG
jgi:hypothetical protein